MPVCLSVCRLLGAAPSKWISMQFDIVDFYVNLLSECRLLNVFLTVHHELTILYINYQLDALIIIYS